MEEEYNCPNCGAEVLRNATFYKCYGCGDYGNISELIKKPSKLEQSTQSPEHPFGEWAKEPLGFP